MSVSGVKGDCFGICYTTQKPTNAQTCQAVQPGVYSTDEWYRLRVLDSGRAHAKRATCTAMDGDLQRR